LDPFFDPDIESDDDNDSAIGFDRFQEVDETLQLLSEAGLFVATPQYTIRLSLNEVFF
jgi:hypothetical protein